MAYVIADPCIDQKGQSCVEVRPVDAEDQLPAQWRRFSAINADHYENPA